MITPAGASYSMFDAAEAVTAASGGLGAIEVSLKTGKTVDTSSDEYIHSHLLISTTIPPNETIRKIIVFPHPIELQGPQDSAFRCVYRLLIEGLIKSDKSIPFPELTWDADSTRIKWAELEKRFQKR